MAILETGCFATTSGISDEVADWTPSPLSEAAVLVRVRLEIDGEDELPYKEAYRAHLRRKISSMAEPLFPNLVLEGQPGDHAYVLTVRLKKTIAPLTTRLLGLALVIPFPVEEELATTSLSLVRSNTQAIVFEGEGDPARLTWWWWPLLLLPVPNHETGREQVIDASIRSALLKLSERWDLPRPKHKPKPAPRAKPKPKPKPERVAPKAKPKAKPSVKAAPAQPKPRRRKRRRPPRRTS